MNPPAVFPTDPHLLAQWRFDERRRRNDDGGVTLHRVAMVLGRFADRVEIRNPAEAPEVAESARAIAAETDKPAYRAALAEVADRISAHFGEQPPADAARPAAEDWLASLDAHLAATPHAGNGGSAHAPPLRFDPAPAGDDGLPDFLSGTGWDAPAAASSNEDAPVADLPLLPAEPQADETVDETVDEALYIPPTLGEEDGPAPDEPLPFLAPDAGDDGDGTDDALFEPWAAGAPDTADGRASGVDDAGHVGEQPTPPASVPVFAVVTLPADDPPTVAGYDPAAALDRSGGAAAQLVGLGRTLGLAVSDRAATDGRAADGGDPLASLDVVWREGATVAAAFRIASNATLAAALLDLADVLADTAGPPPPLFLVGPAALREAARAAARRPALVRLPVPLAAGCAFLAVESLRSALERAADFLPYLRPGFVRALAERLDG